MTDRPKTIHFVSLGCAKNRVDTEVMLGVSERRGARHVADPADADVIVVNTCGFIGPAKEESIDTVVQMAGLKADAPGGDGGRCRKLVVAGCLSQRYADELARELPEVDHFLGSSDMLVLDRILDPDQAPPARLLVGHPADWLVRATDPRRLSVRAHSAFVKIAEGCNRVCSFCAIPGIRGKQRSRPVADVVREVERLVADGLVEANLVSQDTVAYGRDLPGRPSLADLVEAVAEVPETLDRKLIALLGEHPKVLPYVDMPLQHASDRMLRRMRRGHGGDRMKRVVDRLRASVPDLVFRSTFIVGHPGETDGDFDELLGFLRWAELGHVGAFLYSHEAGTAAGEMTDLVPRGIARKRHRKLVATQRPISRRKLKARVGRTVEVLVDGPSDESDFLLDGRFWGQAPEVDGKIVLANGQARAGEIRRALVTAAADYDLVGDLLADDGVRDTPEAGPPGRPRARVRLPTVSG